MFDCFDITLHKTVSERLYFYLKEKNILPDESKTEKSKGFSPEITVENSPLRGKPVLLYIKRGWKLAAKGTRITICYFILLEVSLKLSEWE